MKMFYEIIFMQFNSLQVQLEDLALATLAFTAIAVG
jgi:hypothetical protein